jgi:predicted nucleic acid-binding protein
VQLLRVDPAIVERATRIGPPHLRTLDALHLASALEVSPPPAAFLCYDRRLAEAARFHGFDVVAPGVDEVNEA